MVGRSLRRGFALGVAGALSATVVMAAVPGSARAGEIARACAAVDRSHRTACDLERRSDGEWVLTTRLVVDTGAKTQVAALERRFCENMRAQGQRGRVLHWSALPGAAGNAAKTEWSCEAPSVSSAPPSSSSVPSYGGAYIPR